MRRTLPVPPRFREAIQRMNPAPTKPQPTHDTLRIEVGNVTPADAQFLRNCVALLTDPANAEHISDVRSGKSMIAYRSHGALHVIPTEAE